VELEAMSPGRERLECPKFRQDFIPGVWTKRGRGGGWCVGRNEAWCKAITKWVVLKTQETWREEQGMWVMQSVLHAFWQHQATLHSQQFSRHL
jgi:hypothetical protein